MLTLSRFVLDSEALFGKIMPFLEDKAGNGRFLALAGTALRDATARRRAAPLG